MCTYGLITALVINAKAKTRVFGKVLGGQTVLGHK